MKKSLFLITLIISSAFSLIPAMEPVNAGSYGTKEGVLRVYNSKGLVEEHQVSYLATNNEAKDFIDIIRKVVEIDDAKKEKKQREESQRFVKKAIVGLVIGVCIGIWSYITAQDA